MSRDVTSSRLSLQSARMSKAALSTPWRDKVARLFIRHCSRDPSVKTVLDIGCSDGEVVAELAAANPRLRFIGIDVRADELQIAKSRVAQKALANVDLVHDYFLDRGTDASHDAATYSEVYEHLVAEKQVLSLRVIGCMLRPGGYLIFTTPNGRYLRSPLERHKTFTTRYPEDFFADLRQTFHWLEPSLDEASKIFYALGYDIVECGYFNLPFVHRTKRLACLARSILEPLINLPGLRWLADRCCKNIFIVARKNPSSRLLSQRELA
jgi:SAM-dependent methyltransferase